MKSQIRYRITQSMDEHRDVLAAIKAGDSQKAETVLKAHIVIQGEKFSDLVSSLQ